MSVIKIGNLDRMLTPVPAKQSKPKVSGFNVPKGAQILIYPMMECTVAAGFKNKKYAMDPQHAFPHYGVDFDERGASGFNVIASGIGTVLGVEQNTNSLGGVVVIQYDDVFIPSTEKVKPLILRYYHLYDIKVKKGQTVAAYSTIGTVSGSHKWWNHVHVEVDGDIKYPFYTMQVSEKASKLLVRKGANDKNLYNPIDVFVIGKKQTAMVHPLAVYVNAATDTPKYKEEDFYFEPKEEKQAPQKLILPMKYTKVTCGYKNAAYYKEFKFNHYGMDVVNLRGDTRVYASGNGKVIAAGWDGPKTNLRGAGAGCGYVAVIEYDNAAVSGYKKPIDVICTYMHFAEKPLVKTGDIVTSKTLIGYYGQTGRYPTGPHLHIQFDTDTNYPLYCYGSGTEHKLLKKGTTDSTIDPLDVLYKGTGQSVYAGKHPEYFDAKKVASLKSV